MVSRSWHPLLATASAALFLVTLLSGVYRLGAGWFLLPLLLAAVLVWSWWIPRAVILDEAGFTVVDRLPPRRRCYRWHEVRAVYVDEPKLARGSFWVVVNTEAIILGRGFSNRRELIERFRRAAAPGATPGRGRRHRPAHR